ncbi:MAG: molybdate ABC transporter substrate-binding protein [Synechococcales cyanobacterium C42_A2020_086]|jgi:molybdate transport system substrate-binding protein|nr:molybdate ABC transporter substrate-binding protein [Synechococcales cyanobacterium C42_A2020_086]
MKAGNLLTWLACAFASLILTVSCATSPAPSDAPVELTLSSAIALTEPLQAIKPIYEEEHPNTTITYNFGASGELRQQIGSGAPVDVFISAAQKDMDELEKANLLAANTRHNLVKNQIVLAVPSDSSKINSLQDLTQADVTRIAIGNPDTVPIGRYSEEIFKNLGLSEQVQPKLILGKNVRQVLGYVEAGNVDAALVWVTDAKTTDKVKIVETIPENLHSPAIHPIAVIAASTHPKEAEDYVQFLLSDQSKSIFEQYGFTPVS